MLSLSGSHDLDIRLQSYTNPFLGNDDKSISFYLCGIYGDKDIKMGYFSFRTIFKNHF